MNLNCAILHADPEIAGRLEEYIGKVPFLSLHGKYGNPLEALKDYYETKVEVYFVGIYPVEEGEINGMDFCRLLSSSTRVIFITDTDQAARWFSLQDAGTSAPKQRQGPEEVPKVIYMRCDNRIMRLDLERINYIEGMGDYVKIFCKDSPKPILSSFIVRMDCISAIGRSTLLIEQKDVPIGDAYRERVKGYVSRLAVL